MRNLFPAAAVAIALAVSAPAAEAQDARQWRQTLYLYGMGAAIEGNSQIGNLSLPVDVSTSDVLDALIFGAMATDRIENGEWAVRRRRHVHAAL